MVAVATVASLVMVIGLLPPLVPAVADSPPPLVWAAGMGGSIFEAGLDVAVDGSGNVYATGGFQGTADFDPGPGVVNLTAAGDYDVFLSRLDRSGNLVWALSVGGSRDDLGTGVAVDGLGNVYLTGVFSGTVDFDPGPAVFNLSSAGFDRDDVFVLKLNSSGNLVWAGAMGGTGSDRGLGVAVDGLGNVYTTGYFYGPADFDPGPGVFNLTAAGGEEVFVSKLDGSGNLVWAGAMGGISGDRGYGVAVDGLGNVYTTGVFAGTADFDPGPGVVNLTAAGTNNAHDVFVSKLDSAGNLVWVAGMGGANVDYGKGVAVDGLGNVYTTGFFEGTVDFDPGPGVVNLTSAGPHSAVFVSKLDGAGSFVWARSIGGAGGNGDSGDGVAVDGLGNVYTTGRFSGTADFDPGPGVVSVTAAGGTDIFVSKLDGSGSFVWAGSMGGTGNDNGEGVAVDGLGNVNTTGSFAGTADFDPGTGVLDLTSAGLSDVFVSKLGDVTAPVVTLTTPAEGATFVRDVLVLADYACSDEVGGSGLASCVGDVADGAAIDTSTLGARTFTVTGTDNAGNTTVVVHNYTVLPTCDGQTATHVGTAAGDVIIGGPGPDVIVGLAGDDLIDGGGGDDTICAGGGDDVIIPGLGDDTVFGEQGSDTVDYSGAPGPVSVNLASKRATGADGTDIIDNVENIIGSAYADTLRGNAKRNTIWGGAGDDRIQGLGGNDDLYGEGGDDNLNGRRGDDLLVGGPGIDQGTFLHASGPVTADLGTGLVTGDGTDTLVSIENLLGSRFADVLWGNGQPNLLIGAKGNDDLFGRGGDDLLIGNKGFDAADGGGGTDTCRTEIQINCE